MKGQGERHGTRKDTTKYRYVCANQKDLAGVSYNPAMQTKIIVVLEILSGSISGYTMVYHDILISDFFTLLTHLRIEIQISPLVHRV